MLQQRRRYAVKTINWGYWGSVGVAAGETHRQNMARLGLGSIEPQEGMDALRALMSSDLPQMALVKTVRTAAAATATQVTSATRAAARPVGTGRSVSDHVRQIIVDRLCEELRLEPSMVRDEASMSDYGVDSIVGVNLVRSISEALQIPLEPSTLFDYRTVSQLTAYIVENWGSQIAALAVPLDRAEETAAVRVAQLHPLLHVNTSTLGQQSYRTTLTEPLPDAAWLEMARAAIQLAADISAGDSVIELHDVVWGERLVVNGETGVAIALLEGDEGRVSFEIYSEQGVHCQGRLAVNERQSPPRLSAGAAHDPKEIARVTVSESAGYLLDPAAMTAALKAAMALVPDAAAVRALDRLRVWSACRGEMVAWVRPAAGDAGKIDIDLAAPDGNVCAQAEGVAFRIATPASALETLLREEAARHLSRLIDAVSLDATWTDLGFTAPSITSFVESVNLRLGTALSPSALFDHKDMRSLAAYLDLNRESAAPQPLLTPFPRRKVFTRAAVAESEASGDELLDAILWQEEPLAGSYEKVTF
jgi:acyl carrier protein